MLGAGFLVRVQESPPVWTLADQSWRSATASTSNADHWMLPTYVPGQGAPGLVAQGAAPPAPVAQKGAANFAMTAQKGAADFATGKIGASMVAGTSSVPTAQKGAADFAKGTIASAAEKAAWDSLAGAGPVRTVDDIPVDTPPWLRADVERQLQRRAAKGSAKSRGKQTHKGGRLTIAARCAMMGMARPARGGKGRPREGPGKGAYGRHSDGGDTDSHFAGSDAGAYGSAQYSADW